MAALFFLLKSILNRRLLFWSIFFFTTSTCSSFDLGDEKPIETPRESVFSQDVRWGPGQNVAFVQNIIAYKCDNCHGSGRSTFTPSNAPLINLSLLDKAKNLASYSFYMKRSFQRVANSPQDPMPPTYATPLTPLELESLLSFLASEAGQ